MASIDILTTRVRARGMFHDPAQAGIGSFGACFDPDPWDDFMYRPNRVAIVATSVEEVIDEPS